MARDDTERRNAEMLERSTRSRPAQAMTQYDRIQARKRNTARGEALGAQVQRAKNEILRPASQQIASYVDTVTGKKKKKGKTAQPAPPVAPQLADPGINPTTRQPLDRSTRVGLGGQGVTGFQSAAQQLSELRRQSDEGAPLPGRETADRGFQYQPSQWAQQNALRNARVGFNATANKYRDQRGLKAAQSQLAAEFQGNPALQGLERSKLYQDNITTDQNAAITQRGQDASFNLGLRQMRGDERQSAARNLSAEGIAANRDAAALQGIETRGEYDLRGEQVRAQAGYEAAQLKAAIDQRAGNREQAQQDFDNIRTMVSDATTQQDDEGQPIENPRGQQELTNFLVNSQITGTQEAKAAIGAYTQFARGLQAAGEVADSSSPIMARLFGWFEANKGKPVNEKQLQAEMSRLVTDADFRREFSSTDQYRAFLQSLPYSNLQ